MSKNINVCYSHNTDNWKTPSNIYNHFVNKLGYIDLFPYCSDEDQYEKSYICKRLFCNPPFSQMDKVVDYLIHLYHLCNEIMLLCPARTDTKWFHKLLQLNPTIYFIKGRLHFNDGKGCAPFPTIFIFISKCNVLPFYSNDLTFMS